MPLADVVADSCLPVMSAGLEISTVAPGRAGCPRRSTRPGQPSLVDGLGASRRHAHAGEEDREARTQRAWHLRASSSPPPFDSVVASRHRDRPWHGSAPEFFARPSGEFFKIFNKGFHACQASARSIQGRTCGLPRRHRLAGHELAQPLRPAKHEAREIQAPAPRRRSAGYRGPAGLFASPGEAARKTLRRWWAERCVAQAQRRPDHARHHPRRPPGLLRRPRRQDPDARRPRARRRALRTGRHGRPAHDARPFLDHDGPLPDLPRRARERHDGPQPGTDDARGGARAAGLPDGRLRRRLRARRTLGTEPGLRQLRRPLRPEEVQAPRPGGGSEARPTR